MKKRFNQTPWNTIIMVKLDIEILVQRFNATLKYVQFEHETIYRTIQPQGNDQLRGFNVTV